MHIVDRLIRAVRSRLGLPPRIVREKILSYHLTFREGLRESADYDDAWNFALIKQSRVMFDVGCNVGFFALLGSISDPKRKVVAIDPNPQALDVAAENLSLNACSSQANLILAFAGEKEGEAVEFFTVGTGAAGSAFPSHAKTAAEKGKSFKVTTTTLDAVSRETSLIPDLVKIDVEGAEFSVLKGAKKIASANKTRFLVEMHSSPDLPMMENGKRIFDWCREMSFDGYYLKEHRLIDSPAIYAHRGRCHILLQPKGWDYPVFLKEIRQGDPLEKVPAG